MELIKSAYEELLDASHLTSFECSQKITDIIKESLPIKACSFYSFYKETHLLTLRAQTGFSYEDYESFELDLGKLAGIAIDNEEIVRRENVKLEKRYRDRNIIKKYNLSHFIAIPLKANSCINAYGEMICQDYIGVICMYPEGASSYNNFDNNFAIYLSGLIGKIYSYSMTADKIAIRSDIVNTSIVSKDLNSFLHKVLKTLSDKWFFESSSVFLYDEGNETLLMRATTGVTSKLKLIERLYRKNQINHNTVKCFLEKKTITVIDPDKSLPNGKYSEIVSDEKRSEIYIPIVEPFELGTKKEVTGILRTVNRIVARNNLKEVCCHGWEDVSLLLFVSEVIGIISYLYRRTDEITLNFERAMHGINKPIKAAKVRLKSVQRFAISSDIVPATYSNDIKNSLSYLETVEWQIQKHTGRDDYDNNKKYKVNIFGDVLSKIVTFVDEIHQTYNIKEVSVNKLINSGFQSIPPVLGNERAFQSIFRNIVENALKYHKKRILCEISFKWRQDNKFVYISISDNGIGINRNDVNKIFREGYRTLDAMRKEPTGTGIGLSDSKSIIESMGGDLYLDNNKNPTTFTVKIKKFNYMR